MHSLLPLNHTGPACCRCRSSSGSTSARVPFSLAPSFAVAGRYRQPKSQHNADYLIAAVARSAEGRLSRDASPRTCSRCAARRRCIFIGLFAVLLLLSNLLIFDSRPSTLLLSQASTMVAFSTFATASLALLAGSVQVEAAATGSHGVKNPLPRYISTNLGPYSPYHASGNYHAARLPRSCSVTQVSPEDRLSFPGTRADSPTTGKHPPTPRSSIPHLQRRQEDSSLAQKAQVGYFLRPLAQVRSFVQVSHLLVFLSPVVAALC